MINGEAFWLKIIILSIRRPRTRTMQPERLIIFDTTLRDGEQCPGASMNNKEKLEIARQLALLKVDVIEAGFPVASPGDFESVQQIANEIKGSSVAGLARALEKDVSKRQRVRFEKAESPRIHIFLSTSKLHRDHKLQKGKDEIIQMAVDAVKFGRKFCDDIEFSPEDASRTEPEFLAEVVEAVIDAGAGTVNIPDTVGYSVPTQFGQIIRSLKAKRAEHRAGDHQRALSQRSGHGGGEFTRSHQRRRSTGGVHHQRYR